MSLLRFNPDPRRIKSEDEIKSIEAWKLYAKTLLDHVVEDLNHIADKPLELRAINCDSDGASVWAEFRLAIKGTFDGAFGAVVVSKQGNQASLELFNLKKEKSPNRASEGEDLSVRQQIFAVAHLEGDLFDAMVVHKFAEARDAGKIPNVLKKALSSPAKKAPKAAIIA